MEHERKAEGDEPVKLLESFRLAKRNVLFWSAVTFVLLYGVEGKEGAQTAFLRELSFEKWFLVSASLVVLLFMAVGFYNAVRRVVHFNSPLEVSARLSSVSDSYEKLKVTIDDSEKRMKDIDGQIKNAKREVGSLAESIGEIKNVEATTPLLTFQERFQFPQGGESMAELARRDPTEFYSRASAVSDEIVKQYKAAVLDKVEMIAVTMEERLARAEKRTEDVAHQLPEITRSLQDSIKEFTGFSRAIGDTESAWFWNFDIGAVWTAIMISGLSAAIWLLHYAPFHDLISR